MKKKKKKSTRNSRVRRGAAARRGGAAPKSPTPSIGAVGWVDLTVPNAEALRDFYAAVVGWASQDIDMGGYSDYCMVPPGEAEPSAGVCHARGMNEGLPRAWLVYFVVEDVARAVAEVERRGGRVVRPAGPMGPMGRFAVIEDPAGAVCALFERAR